MDDFVAASVHAFYLIDMRVDDDGVYAVWPVIGWATVGQAIRPVTALRTEVKVWADPFELYADGSVAWRRAEEMRVQTAAALVRELQEKATGKPPR